MKIDPGRFGDISQLGWQNKGRHVHTSEYQLSVATILIATVVDWSIFKRREWGIKVDEGQSAPHLRVRA